MYLIYDLPFAVFFADRGGRQTRLGHRSVSRFRANSLFVVES